MYHLLLGNKFYSKKSKIFRYINSQDSEQTSNWYVFKAYDASYLYEVKTPLISSGIFHANNKAELPIGKHSKLSTGPGLPSGVSTLIVLEGGPLPFIGPAPLKATTRA